MYLQNNLPGNIALGSAEQVLAKETKLLEKHREEVKAPGEIPGVYVKAVPAKLRYSTPDNAGRQRSIRFFG